MVIKLKDLLEVNTKFINELKYVHRYMESSECLKLLKDKKVTSKKKFISFTLHPETAASAGFSGILITFDRKNLEKLNPKMVEVYYEPEFMDQYPDISLYVTGYRSESDYEGDFSWDSFIEMYEEEQEIVIPKTMKIDNNSIVNIEAPKKNKKKLKDFEKEYPIVYV